MSTVGPKTQQKLSKLKSPIHQQYKKGCKMLLRRAWIAIFIFVFCQFIIGCSKIQFVVLRDVPASPSFVVIPANDYLNQVAFANRIEEAIIGAGVKVVMFSRTTKEVTKEVAVGGKIAAVEGSQVAQKSGEGKLTERYVVSLDEIKADYIVLTYSGSKQIRVIKNQTREILAVLTVPADAITGELLEHHDFIAHALGNMGVAVTSGRR